MKVLIVDNTQTFGGAFELAVTLAEFLEKTGQASPCLVSGQPQEILDQRKNNGVGAYHLLRKQRMKIAHLPLGIREMAALFNISMKDLPAAFKLAKIARHEKADVIHLNNLLNDQPYGVIGAKLAGLPCICSHRDYEYSSPLIRILEKFVDHHIACSKPIERNLHELGVPDSKIAYIWDGVDIRKFAPSAPADLNELFGIPSGKKIVSIFGRLVDWKGHDIFLKAAAKWLPQFPDAHALVIGGVSDGAPEFEPMLRRMAADLGIASRVTFTGYRTDIAALMRASDILVHASLKPEPFGTVVLEGMACGKPYVAMNEGGPNEMIEDGISGLVVRPRDPEAMAKAISSLLSDDEFARRLGAAARERIVRHFSAEEFAANHLNLYRRFAA
jgi:glycosyltransferase involved in cell wall biosynthesis